MNYKENGYSLYWDLQINLYKSCVLTLMEK